jgi:hypothetical protein
MRIGAAWCVELGRVVDGLQAKAAYFAQPEPRRRFTFLCSNERCRNERSPRVIGVNYDKLYTDETRPAAPHFRVHPDDTHAERCPWVLRDQAQHRYRGHGPVQPSLNAQRRFAIEADTRIVDLFEPATGPEREPTDDLWHVPARAPHTPATVEAIAERMRTRPVRSHRLQDLVTCYLELGAVDRLRAMVRVAEGRPTPYTRFFQPLARFAEGHDPTVYFGGARVARVEHGFVLYFYDRVQVAGDRREVSLYLSDRRLSESESGGLMRELLLACIAPGNYAKVYFFGEIGPSVRKPHAAAVRITDLENVVVHPAHVRTPKVPQAA